MTSSVVRGVGAVWHRRPMPTTTVPDAQREISLLRLVAQGVVGRRETPREVVARLTAVQAQDEAGAQLSIALRAGVPRSAVVAEYDAGTVVRSWTQRGTLHAVLADDLPWMAELMNVRPMAAQAKRRPQLDLDASHVARANDATVAALRGGGRLARAELMAVWADAGLETSGGRGYHLLSTLGHAGLVCFGPTRDGEQLIVLVEEWVPAPRTPTREEALRELALRYFLGHGPATVPDLVRWTGLTAKDARAGLALALDELATLEVDGVTYYLDRTIPALLEKHRAAAEATLLLPGFDEMVLGYADRTATVPARFADRIVPGGNGVFRHTVVDRGVVVGAWRAVGSGRNRRVEVEAFEDLTPAVTEAVPALFAALP